MAVVTPSILQAATGNTFPGGTAYVFQYDVNNPRPDRRDDLVKIWFPNEATPFMDAAARTVNVAGVYASATPRYVVEYGQDPTDADLYGRVVRETVGDPANGVGGTYQYLYTTQGLPGIPFPSDPADTLVFRCVLTDRNDNQTVYDFNAAQMPVRVEVIRSRGKIDIPSTVTWPSYVTWTQYNSQNQPVLQVLPAGNSLAFTYENGIDLGLSGPLQPPRGVVAQSHGLSGQFPGDRAGSSGQQRAESAYGDLLLRADLQSALRGWSGGATRSTRRAATSHPRISARPAPRGTRRSRPMTTRRMIRARSAAIRPCRRRWASAPRKIDALYTFVNTQMGNAGLTPFQTGFPSGLGDINGDGTGNGASSGLPAARHLGNVVQVWHPAVNLINPDPNTGSTTQNRIEVFTTNALGPDDDPHRPQRQPDGLRPLPVQRPGGQRRGHRARDFRPSSTAA